MPKLELYSLKINDVPPKSGLNWCLADAHVAEGDAYITLTTAFFYNNPDFFPIRGEIIEVNWDDGTRMFCLLEGKQQINGKFYPKQISSYNKKAELGKYIRSRLNVKLDHLVTMNDLINYGRKDIDVTKIDSHKFYFDFHVQ